MAWQYRDDVGNIDRGAAARGPRRAGERHRRGLQLRPRPAGPDPALGGRGRSADARPSSPTAATARCRDGETFYTYQRGIPELRAALAALSRAHRSAGRSRAERFFVTGGGMQAIQIAVADGRRQRRRGDRADAGLAEHRRRRRHRRRDAGRWSPMSFGKPAGRSISTGCSTRRRARTTRDLRQLAVQSDRLDGDAGRASRDPRLRARSAASGSSPTRSTPLRTIDGRARALLLRRRRGGRPRPLRQHLLQELGDDRLAHRLDLGAAGARPGDREPHPVFDLGRRRLHAARRRRGARRGRRFRRACRSSAPGRGREIVCGGLAGDRPRPLRLAGGRVLSVLRASTASRDTQQLGLRLVDEANIGIAPGDAFGEGGAGFIRLCFLRRAEHDRRRRRGDWSTWLGG